MEGPKTELLWQLLNSDIPEVVDNKISNVKENGSPREGGIPPNIPMATLQQISIPLAHGIMFNMLQQERPVPLEWKAANTIHLFYLKRSINKSINFRQVSFTSVIYQTFIWKQYTEIIMADFLIKYKLIYSL